MKIIALAASAVAALSLCACGTAGGMADHIGNSFQYFTQGASAFADEDDRRQMREQTAGYAGVSAEQVALLNINFNQTTVFWDYDLDGDDRADGSCEAVGTFTNTTCTAA